MKTSRKSQKRIIEFIEYIIMGHNNFIVTEEQINGKKGRGQRKNKNLGNKMLKKISLPNYETVKILANKLEEY